MLRGFEDSMDPGLRRDNGSLANPSGYTTPS